MSWGGREFEEWVEERRYRGSKGPTEERMKKDGVRGKGEGEND